MLIGRREFERLTGRYRAFADAFDDFREEVDLPELAIDPDEVFGGTRENSHVSWT